MIPRSFSIDAYTRDVDRTVVLVRRGDGRIGAHDIHTGTLLGIVDPRDYRDEDRIAVEDDAPVPFFQGLLFALTALVVVGVVCLICFHAGRLMGGG